MQSYSRFADNEQIKRGLSRIDRSLNVNYSGIPYFHDENSIYVDDKDSHTVVIGSTGSGKTQTTVLPQLRLSMLANESMVVIDEMGELYKKLGSELNKRNYKTFVINFQDTTCSNNFNPLLVPYHFPSLAGEHYTEISPLFPFAKIQKKNEIKVIETVLICPIFPQSCK